MEIKIALNNMMMKIFIVVPVLLVIFFIWLLFKSLTTHKTDEVGQNKLLNKRGIHDLYWFTKLIVNAIAPLGILFILIVLLFNPYLFTHSFLSTKQLQNNCVGSKTCIAYGIRERSRSQRILATTLLVTFVLPLIFNKDKIFNKKKNLL